jgi:spore coat protein SA
MRHDPDKNPLLLLKGLSHVANVCERVKVQIAGDGMLREDLGKAAESLGLICVEFLGPQNETEVGELFKASDIYVNPSSYPLQTWGIANLEAMAGGLAVIAFNVGGTADYLLHGVNCLVPEFNGAGIGAAIERLLQDVNLRNRLGRAARTTAEGHTASRMRERYESIYKG